LDTHDGRDGELLLLGVLEETEDIVADDDAGLAVQLFKDTHYEVCAKKKDRVEIWKKEEKGQMAIQVVEALYRETENGREGQWRGRKRVIGEQSGLGFLLTGYVDMELRSG
jgi:hypothetical protein